MSDMRILISGSSGLIGTAVRRALEADGHTIVRLTRPNIWDPGNGTIDLSALDGTDAVIHLAGETIAGLWTAAKRRRILESRVKGTTLLSTSLGKLERQPSALISASAIGFYGDRPGDQPADETAPKGRGFLADVVEQWERSTDPARAAGVRVVNTRFGLVMSPKGGALGPMLPLFKLGLGGKLGSGRQIWSWVSIDDVVGAIRFALRTPTLEGPVNVVAPQPVTNLAFTRALGRVLRRPTILGVPELLLKAVAGNMAEEMLLFGVRAVPRKLLQSGFVFEQPELENALRHLMLSDSRKT
jgi:uncharacterized protein (TIGR01777 family)